MSFFLYKNNRDFQKGFTLLEVLAALVLLSLVLSWLIPAFIQILDSNTKAEHQLEAYLLGYGKLEEIIGRLPGPGITGTIKKRKTRNCSLKP